MDGMVYVQFLFYFYFFADFISFSAQFLFFLCLLLFCAHYFVHSFYYISVPIFLFLFFNVGRFHRSTMNTWILGCVIVHALLAKFIIDCRYWWNALWSARIKTRHILCFVSGFFSLSALWHGQYTTDTHMIISRCSEGSVCSTRICPFSTVSPLRAMSNFMLL